MIEITVRIVAAAEGTALVSSEVCRALGSEMWADRRWLWCGVLVVIAVVELSFTEFKVGTLFVGSVLHLRDASISSIWFSVG